MPSKVLDHQSPVVFLSHFLVDFNDFNQHASKNVWVSHMFISVTKL